MSRHGVERMVGLSAEGLGLREETTEERQVKKPRSNIDTESRTGVARVWGWWWGQANEELLFDQHGV